ncbi:Gfo/Idh/MocA family protein [Kitasatospora sp. NPDC059327]|uniref:Gfo/Idh/MocA family protein n=1 Tax=Kitasatospora sp. NPDC059327 TaxID=3346803 RepID=UPI0036A20600
MKRRAAVIGLGHQALEDHLPGLLASNRAELVAVCDRDPDTLRAQLDTHHVPGFTRAADLLDDVAPDFVIVAVPHHAGRAVIEECAVRGVHAPRSSGPPSGTAGRPSSTPRGRAGGGGIGDGGWERGPGGPRLAAVGGVPGCPRRARRGGGE